MGKQPKVSFLMNSYNAEQYISETIQSVQAQTDPFWELFIRNNGSTDRTGEICEQFAAEDKRIHVIHNKVNMLSDDGFHRCERGFWPAPSGEYIAHLDSDDILHPDFVCHLYQKAEETGADIAVGGCVHFLDGKDPFCSEHYREDILPEMHLNTRQEIFHALDTIIFSLVKVMWGKVIRTDFWEKLYSSYQLTSDHFKCVHHEDIFWGFHLLTQVNSVSCVGESLYYYRRRMDSMYHTVNCEDVLQNRLPVSLYLYQYCVECMEKDGFLTPKNAVCVYDVIAGQMLNLMRGATHSDMDLAERRKYLKGITTESGYAEPYFFELSWKKFRPAFLDTLRPYEQTLNTLDSWHDWMLRLYFAASGTEIPAYLEMLALYSAIYDSENINGFGIGELQHHKGKIRACDQLLEWAENTQSPSALLRRKPFCLKILSGGFSIDMEEERKKAAELALEYHVAASALKEMEEHMPFDPSVIYLHVRFYQQSGQADTAYQTAACGCALYPEDEALNHWLSKAKEQRGQT